MTPPHHEKEDLTRHQCVSVLLIVEDVLYMILAVVMVGLIAWILGMTVLHLDFSSVKKLTLQVLDHLMVILMLMEILHTLVIIQKTHKFTHEPFLIVGIIAGIRRILVITAEQSMGISRTHSHFFLDLSITTLMVVALTLVLHFSRKNESGT